MEPTRQFNIHRGISDIVDTLPGTSELGMHWSTKKSVAQRFALGEPHFPSNFGTILHGVVNKQHTLQPDNPEYEAIASKYGILIDNPSNEREVTVKPGSPVSITGKTIVQRRGPKGGIRTRKRTYNPSREVKA